MVAAPSRWASRWPRLTLLSARGVPVRANHDQPENEMRVDGDVICPRCLRFVWPHEYVRRNVLGLVQHQVCPDPEEDCAAPGQAGRVRR